MGMDSQGLLYFAYGEHMNEAEMLRDFPHARMVGLSRLPGYRLCFLGRDGMARAAVEPSPRGSVVGRVWALSERDVPALDRAADAPRTARGELVIVQVDGMSVPALAYITAKGQHGRPGFITYDLLREAYEEAGEDVEGLRDLAAQSVP